MTTPVTEPLPRIRKVSPTVAELRRHISWSFFFSGWGLPGRYPDIFADEAKGDAARTLYADAVDMLDRMERSDALRSQGLIGEFFATADGDALVLQTREGEKRLPMYRKPDTGECVADFVGTGCVVRLFALSAAFGIDEFCDAMNGDDYGVLLAKTLAGRLAEAMADFYLPDGCRLAVGYPSLPDHTLKRDILSLIDPASRAGFALTETSMLIPCQSVIGIHLPCEDGAALTRERGE